MSSFVQVVNVSVFWRLGHAHLDDVQWKRLRDQNLLPKSCPISKPLQCSKQLLKVKIIQSRYRVRSLGSHHCGYQVWRNQISKEAQEIYVANLERSLHEDSSCESKLQDIFRAAVVALSPPRLLPMSEYGRFHTKGPEEMEGHYGSTVALTSSDWSESGVGCLEKLQDPRIQRFQRSPGVFGDFTKQEVSELAGFKGVPYSLKHRDWLNLQIFRVVC